MEVFQYFYSKKNDAAKYMRLAKRIDVDVHSERTFASQAPYLLSLIFMLVDLVRELRLSDKY